MKSNKIRGGSVLVLTSCFALVFLGCPATFEPIDDGTSVAGVVASIDVQQQAMLVTRANANARPREISLQWSPSTRFRRADMTIGSAEDLRVGQQIRAGFVATTAGTFATHVWLGTAGGVLELTDEECDLLGCDVIFDVKCPRTGKKGPKDRYRCKCSVESTGVCIDE